MKSEIKNNISLAFPQSPEEEVALFAFEEAVSDLIENPEPHYLLRWLRARDLNIANAREMLQKNFEWRNAHPSLEDLSNWEADPMVEKNIRYKFTGVDAEGRPVIWAPLGRYNLPQLIGKGLKDETVKLLRRIMEDGEAQIEIQRQKTETVTQAVVVFDMEELSFSKIASIDVVQTMMGFFREFESFYPEVMHSAYIINAHWVFFYAFNLVKPIMSARTIGKIQVFGKDRKKWESVLRQNIPADALPEEYGGTGERVL